MVASGEKFLEKLPNRLVKSFCEPIGKRIVYCGRHALNAKFDAEVLEYVIDELGPIVVHNTTWDTEVVVDVVLDKFGHVNSLDFSKMDNLRTFGEVISNGQYEPMSFVLRGFDRVYDVHPLHIKWPSGLGGGDGTHWLMLEIAWI